MEVSWPQKVSRSFFQWSMEQDRAGTEKLHAEINFARKFASLPIVAVAGLKNSGKSSLVASFLSGAARMRVLRGERTIQGTQRFILWLPDAWQRDAELLERLESQLTGVFGEAAEPLRTDSAGAWAQQREVDRMGVPLLAFDEALDRRGVALLDCPDVECDLPGTEHGPEKRLGLLRAAGEICAGVILVADRRKIEVGELQIIAAQLPSATRIHAVNLLRREAPDEFLRDAPEEILRGDTLCYVAYDFDVDANKRLAPLIDPNFGRDMCAGSEDRLPFFFEASRKPELNAPDVVGPERSLFEIGARLSPGELRNRRQIELVAAIKSQLQAKFVALERTAEARSKELEVAHASLFHALHELMHEGEKPRIKIDPEIATEMAASIQRTAPWDIRIALRMKHKLFGAIRTAASGVKKAALARFLSLGHRGEVAAVKQKLMQLDPARVREKLVVWSAGHGFARDEQFWARDADTILERFRVEERSNLESREWDLFTREFWRNAPKGRARFALALTVLTTLAAAAWLTIEPLTGAAVFSTVVKGHVVTLTSGELFAVFGSVAATAGGFAAKLEGDIERKLGGRQFSNLFAIACDQIGLPRDLPPSRAGDFPPPEIPVELKSDAFGIRERGWIRAVINRKQLAQLQQLADRI